METISFPQGIAVRQVSPDEFENVEEPWSWYGQGTVIPGGVLMSLAAASAYETVKDGFCINTLQTHFLAAPKPSGPLMRFKVQRLRDSGRFSVRVVTVLQSGTIMVHLTCSFVKSSSMCGTTMEHFAPRASKTTINEIRWDDLVPGRSRQGPYMKFQRLPLEYNGPDPKPRVPLPETYVYTSVAQIFPPIQPSTSRLHCLGVIALSDYHVMDAAPTVHGIDFGLPPPNSAPRPWGHERNFKIMTSLNHTINFRLQDGFKVDDLCYVEVTCPWTHGRRSNVQSRIFDRAGQLVATCTQEAYYVFQDGVDKSKL